MRFKKELILEVYVYTDEELEKIKLGVIEEDAEGIGDETEHKIFYAVDCICRHEGSNNTSVWTLAGERCLIKMSINVLREKIKEVS